MLSEPKSKLRMIMLFRTWPLPGVWSRTLHSSSTRLGALVPGQRSGAPGPLPCACHCQTERWEPVLGSGLHCGPVYQQLFGLLPSFLFPVLAQDLFRSFCYSLSLDVVALPIRKPHAARESPKEKHKKKTPGTKLHTVGC